MQQGDERPSSRAERRIRSLTRRSRKRLTRLLPLRVTGVLADSDQITLEGLRWSIGLRRRWRVLDGDQVAFGSSAPDVQAAAESLLGLDVTNLEFVEDGFLRDYLSRVVFSNGLQLDLPLDAVSGQGGQTLSIPTFRRFW